MDLVSIIIAPLLVGLLVTLVIQFFKNKTLISSLRSENMMLTEENNNLKANSLKNEKKTLIYEDRKTILAKYKWDDVLGTWRDKSTNEPHCNSGLSKIPPIESPLQKYGNGFRCTIKGCESVYSEYQDPPDSITPKFGSLWPDK